MNKLFCKRLLGFTTLFALLSINAQAQQAESTVQVQSTISGNQEQPKTIYVLPWQSPVSVIRIPGQSLDAMQPTLSPLDRQQFLRFIAVQSAVTEPAIIQSTTRQSTTQQD